MELHSSPKVNKTFTKRTENIQRYVQAYEQSDFVIALAASDQHKIIYVITKHGNIILNDIKTGKYIVHVQVTNCSILMTSSIETNGKITIVDVQGSVLKVTINARYIIDTSEDADLVHRMINKHNFKGKEVIVVKRFNDLCRNGRYNEAARLAAMDGHDSLESSEIIEKLRNVETENESSPLFVYYGTLLDQGKLNKAQSLELCSLILSKNKNREMLCKKWIDDDKLQCSEELGDLFKKDDPKLALFIYLNAKIHNKAIELLEKILSDLKASEFDERFELETLLILSAVQIQSECIFTHLYLHK